MSDAAVETQQYEDPAIIAEENVMSIINSSANYQSCPIHVGRNLLKGGVNVEEIRDDRRFKDFEASEVIKSIMSISAFAEATDKEKNYCGNCDHTNCPDYNR